MDDDKRDTININQTLKQWPDYLKFHSIQIEFVRFLINKWKYEEKQRLKTEEQSAIVIEELGKQIVATDKIVGSGVSEKSYESLDYK